MQPVTVTKTFYTLESLLAYMMENDCYVEYDIYTISSYNGVICIMKSEEKHEPQRLHDAA